jgi:hypothetical protein
MNINTPENEVIAASKAPQLPDAHHDNAPCCVRWGWEAPPAAHAQHHNTIMLHTATHNLFDHQAMCKSRLILHSVGCHCVVDEVRLSHSVYNVCS